MIAATGQDEQWTRSAPARVARELLIRGVFGPLVGAYARTEVTGSAYVVGISGPAVFVANHSSHIDTPVLLRALPARRRRRTAVAAAADYFYATRPLAVAVSLSFGTVPVRRTESAATSRAPVEGLVAAGWSLVVFAEGTRSRDGRLGPLRPGAAVLSARQGVPIVPVHIGGTAAIMPPGARWMRRPPGAGALGRHPVTVRFGAPVQADPGDDPDEVMQRVRTFLQADSSPVAVDGVPAGGGESPPPGPETPAPSPETPAPGPETPAPGPETPVPGPETPVPGPKTPATGAETTAGTAAPPA